MHTIPKIIWQTHNYTYEDLPEHLKKSINTWKNLNPGWDHRYYSHIDREKYLKQYPDFYTRYINLDPITQADIWRYLVTYEFGGVYSDMDSICIKPLDYMLDNIADNPNIVVIPLSQNGGHTNNANYAVEAKSPIMKDCLDMAYSSISATKLISVWECFVLSVYNGKDVSYDFSSALHSRDFHNIFPTFNVDYYGNSQPYTVFIESKNLSIL